MYFILTALHAIELLLLGEGNYLIDKIRVTFVDTNAKEDWHKAVLSFNMTSAFFLSFTALIVVL